MKMHEINRRGVKSMSKKYEQNIKKQCIAKYNR